MAEKRWRIMFDSARKIRFPHGRSSTSSPTPGMQIIIGNYPWRLKDIQVVQHDPYCPWLKNWSVYQIQHFSQQKIDSVGVAENLVATRRDISMATNPAARIGSLTAWKISPNLWRCMLAGVEAMIFRTGQRRE